MAVAKDQPRVGEEACLFERDLKAKQGLLRGVEQNELLWAKGSEAQTECAADGAACAGDEDGRFAELVECSN